ncbi:MAG TPA: HAMP domain-containing sensor histidine kinase [Gemmatimonadales bacterium]|nr:HAMP domain-containing sensor histidine kinase [Gemmatimonadales bacterium]
MHLSRRLRRAGPTALVALAFCFGGLSVGTAWVVSRHLREDARETSQLFGRVIAGLSDPRTDAATGALLDLAAQVHAFGIPIAITDTTGSVVASENAPDEVARDPQRLRAWAATLDRANPPIVQPGNGTVHYGALPIARRLTLLAVFQAIVLAFLVGLAALAYRTRLAATRDRLWVAMARESAHQLGTPLMSLTGWVAQLREQTGGGGTDVAAHLEADVERLERVARRFERIGRPARREPVHLGAIAERVVRYFEPRLPTRATPVHLSLMAAGVGPTIHGDPVLVEWAIEALVKNAIDALSGRGGRVVVVVEEAGRIARVVVRDDGPGVPAEVRSRLFEPGVTSKTGGWGIGLALARRIVKDQHDGRIYHRGAGPGAEFVLEFPLPAPGAADGAGKRA